MAKVLVYAHGAVHDGDGRSWPQTAMTRDDLIAAMLARGVTTAWTRQPEAWWNLGDLRMTQLVALNGTTRCAMVRTAGPMLKIMSLDDDRWPWSELPPARVASDLARLAEELGGEVAISPGTSGLRVLHEELKRNGWRGAGLEAATKGLHTIDVQFVRPVPSPRRYIHIVDRNAAYLSAARNVTVAIGQPMRAASLVYDGGYGLYRLRNIEVPEGNRHLSMIFNIGRGGGWYHSSTVGWLVELGATFEVVDGLVWPSNDRHRALRLWAERMWRARERLRLSAPAASAAAKTIATATIGMLGHEREKEVKWWYRPDWRAAVVAANGLTFARQIQRLEAHGHAIVAAYIDAIAIATDVADVQLLSVNSEMDSRPVLRLHSGIGAYKPVMSIAGREAEALQQLATERGITASRWLAEAHPCQA